jgi:hypothetical protein
MSDKDLAVLILAKDVCDELTALIIESISKACSTDPESTNIVRTNSYILVQWVCHQDLLCALKNREANIDCSE